ncbi:unnamed protein product [Prorocentrum cordatum]|uniref:Uncharacterized protein n=1 Tax=Prorocentrum cordatum TaxID=2364126 RepID=A0ABN9WV95_9DINO|nr:unnamed protein product [Polarella glacialis]
MEALRSQVLQSQEELAELRRRSGSAIEAAHGQHADDLDGLRQEQGRQRGELQALGREVATLKEQQLAADGLQREAASDTAATKGQLVDALKALRTQRTALGSEVEALQAAMGSELQAARERQASEAEGLREELRALGGELRGQQGAFVEAVNSQLKASIQASLQAVHAKLSADVGALQEQHGKSKTMVDALRGQQGHFMRQHSRDIEGLRDQHLRLHEELEGLAEQVGALMSSAPPLLHEAPSPAAHRSHAAPADAHRAPDGLGHTVAVGALRVAR